MFLFPISFEIVQGRNTVVEGRFAFVSYFPLENIHTHTHIQKKKKKLMPNLLEIECLLWIGLYFPLNWSHLFILHTTLPVLRPRLNGPHLVLFFSFSFFFGIQIWPGSQKRRAVVYGITRFCHVIRPQLRQGTFTLAEDFFENCSLPIIINSFSFQ